MSTLSELRTRARRLADAVGSDFFSDGEVTDYINTGLGELHDLLVSKFEDYYVSSNTFSLISGTSEYTLSSVGIANMYKILGVDMVQGSDTVRIPRYSFQERNTFSSNQALYSNRGHIHHRYNLNGETITFMPEPTSTDTVKIWYVPSYSKLVNDEDATSNSLEYNWEEYAVVSAAIKMRQKEETSVTSLERELERITIRIEESARNRDAGEPMAIVDEDSGVLAGHWLFD